MLGMIKDLLTNQFEAGFCTLNACIDQCPEEHWDLQIGRYPLSQVMFHTLFFVDYYLGSNEDALREQPFHRENAEFFADYEQMLPRVPETVYSRESLKKYLQHCRTKATETIAAETADLLRGPCGFPPRPFTRAELHVYNFRHIFHHAAQITMRLRVETGVDIPWVGSGWKELS
jgi:uncharacterized damage-inducible protein DinB